MPKRQNKEFEKQRALISKIWILISSFRWNALFYNEFRKFATQKTALKLLNILLKLLRAKFRGVDVSM